MKKVKVAAQVIKDVRVFGSKGVKNGMKLLSEDMFPENPDVLQNLRLFKSVKVGWCTYRKCPDNQKKYVYEIFSDVEDATDEEILTVSPCLYGVLKVVPEGDRLRLLSLNGLLVAPV